MPLRILTGPVMSLRRRLTLVSRPSTGQPGHSSGWDHSRFTSSGFHDSGKQVGSGRTAPTASADDAAPGRLTPSTEQRRHAHASSPRRSGGIISWLSLSKPGEWSSRAPAVRRGDRLGERRHLRSDRRDCPRARRRRIRRAGIRSVRTRWAYRRRLAVVPVPTGDPIPHSSAGEKAGNLHLRPHAGARGMVASSGVGGPSGHAVGVLGGGADLRRSGVRLRPVPSVELRTPPFHGRRGFDPAGTPIRRRIWLSRRSVLAAQAFGVAAAPIPTRDARTFFADIDASPDQTDGDRVADCVQV